MPRILMNLHDIDIEAIEELEDLEDWEEQIGLKADDPRREVRDSADSRSRGRGERRFGGAEALDRKRAERRKNFSRASRRI
jgi:hypothetical protein